MTSSGERPFHVIQTVELGTSAADVWSVVGGFYTIHLWHPDIEKSAVPANQTDVGPLRRELTFPGQPVTVEELVLQDNAQWYYRYKWHAGEWGQRVKNYKAEIRVIELEPGRRSLLHWSSTFSYTEDALSEFYWNGFRELQRRFPVGGSTLG